MRIKTRLLIVLFITFVSACIEHNGLRSQNELTDMDGLNIDSIAFLHEIVVTTKPPMFTDEEEKVTMYIEGTPLSESGSARDLLQKSSKIKADDRYGTFVGIKEAMIYVDGREVPDSQILDMLSSNEISKIDIITTPSIRYDSRARAVIEITTIRGKNTGTDLKVNTRMSKGDYWSKLVGTTLNANFSKFTLFSSYIFSPNTRKNQETYLRDVDWSFMPDVYSVKSDIREKIDTRQDHKLRLGGNYYFSDDHKLGLEFSYHSNKGDRRKTTFNHFYLEDGSERPGSDTKKPYNNDFDRSYLTGTVYHQYKNKSGLSLLSSLDISNIKNKKKNIIDEENLGNYPNNGDESDILTLKSDAVIPLPNEFRLEAGIKYTDRHSTSYNDKFIDDEQTQLKRIPKYDFKRKVGAMYGLLSKQFNKLRVGTGLRVEYYDSYIMAEDKVTHDVINWDFPQRWS